MECNSVHLLITVLMYNFHVLYLSISISDTYDILPAHLLTKILLLLNLITLVTSYFSDYLGAKVDNFKINLTFP